MYIMYSYILCADTITKHSVCRHVVYAHVSVWYVHMCA